MTDKHEFSSDLTDSGFFGTEGGDGAEALDPAVVELVDRLMDEAPPGREGLIRVLLGFQQTFNRVSSRVQELVADRYSMSPAQIAAVVSYYPTLSAQRRGRLEIDVCTGTGCFLEGGGGILDAVETSAAARSPAEGDPMLHVRNGHCFGVCGLAPVVLVRDRVAALCTAEGVDDLVERLLEDDSPGKEGR